MNLEEKRARADHVIDNSGSLASTEQQVDEVVKRVQPSALRVACWLGIRVGVLAVAAVLVRVVLQRVLRV